MTPAEVPAEFKALLDQAAGKEHSADGPVMTCLAAILTAHRAMVLAEAAEGQHKGEPFTELVVYPANSVLHGTCPDCGQARHITQFVPGSGYGPATRSEHCGCCTHPHDLSNGRHETPKGEVHDRAACLLCASDDRAKGGDQ